MNLNLLPTYQSSVWLTVVFVEKGRNFSVDPSYPMLCYLESTQRPSIFGSEYVDRCTQVALKFSRQSHVKAFTLLPGDQIEFNTKP